MAYAVLTTSRMENKNIDALNRVGFVGSVSEGVFTGVAAEQGTIVTMTEMCKFSSATAMQKEGYAWIVAKASAGTKTDLWIVDNHEVGYTVAYQTMSAIDPREFVNEAGRAVSVRRVRKHDIIQISKDAFTNAVGSNQYVEVAADGKLKAVAAATNAAFKILGADPMEFGYDQYDAYLLEAIVD